MDDPCEHHIAGWELDESTDITTNNMLRVLESKMIQNCASKQILKNKQVRPMTGRVFRSSCGNYTLANHNKDNKKSLTKRTKPVNNENQNPVGRQGISRTSKSLHLKANNRFQLRKQKAHLKNQSQVDGNGKTICVNMGKRDRNQQINTQREISGKQKQFEQLPLKKQSLIFNSYGLIRAKNSHPNQTSLLNYHQMEIKMRKYKPKLENNFIKADLFLNSLNYRSLKDNKSNTKNSENLVKESGLKAYTSYAKKKRMEKQNEGGQLVERGSNHPEHEIFGDHHFLDDFGLKH